MAQVKITWPASPADEQVTGYQVLMDGEIIGTPAEPEFTAGVEPGVHTFAVASVNLWGPGPMSDSKATPAAATKITGVNLAIAV